MSIPFLEAPPIPLKKLKGTEITRAHGQDITRKEHPRHDAGGADRRLPRKPYQRRDQAGGRAWLCRS